MRADFSDALVVAQPPAVPLAFGGRKAAVDAATREVYGRTGAQLLWVPAEGVAPRTAQLLALLGAAEEEGLSAEAYRPEKLAALVDGLYGGAAVDDLRRVAIDRTLTQAFVLYALDLSQGRLEPRDFEWFVRRDPLDVVDPLLDGLGTDDLARVRARLEPPFPEYRALRARLAHYRAVDAAGGWEFVPDGPKLDVGTEADPGRLAALERRLLADGDLVDGRAEHGGDGSDSNDSAAAAIYDQRLAEAVRRFQRRHGVGADGIVGPRTMRELNTSAHERVRQVEVNLERWRWMPRSSEGRHLRVNIPAFDLALYESDELPVDRMAVVVGRRDWPTPVFSDAVRFIVTNPYWNVPQSIARTELLPKVRRDATFLEREGYVLTDASGQPIEVDPNDVRELSHRTHFLRQLPGPSNALGKMKFMFPNAHDVYLHDTPSRGLFARSERAFSHGCVRVERPLVLAEFLVRDDPEWSMTRLEKLLASGRADRWVRLARRVPIYLLYFTASVDAAGAPRFHPDIYGRDRPVADALLRSVAPQGEAEGEPRVARDAPAPASHGAAPPAGAGT